MQGSTSKTVAIVYGTRLEAITMAPLIHALEGHPWLSTVVMTAGEPGADDLDDVHDVFAIGPEAADPDSGPIAPIPLTDRLRAVDIAIVVASGPTAESLAATEDCPPLVVIDRGDIAVADGAARLHLVTSDARAAELMAAGVEAVAVRVVGDPATQALGELIVDAAGLPNDAMAAVFADSPKWTDRQRRDYARETFLHSALVDPKMRSLLAIAASPFHSSRVGERCIEALEQTLSETESVAA